jgi:hypothetical protein
MLLTFQRLGHTIAVGPVPELQLRGTELFVPGQAAPIASYASGYWSFSNERWTYAVCKTRVLIRLEDDAGHLIASIGPSPSCRIRDRFIFAAREHVLTLLPGQRLWQRAGSTESGSIVRMSS